MLCDMMNNKILLVFEKFGNSFTNILRKFQERFGKLAPCSSATKTMAAKDVWKAIPSQLQLEQKHPLTTGKLTKESVFICSNPYTNKMNQMFCVKSVFVFCLKFYLLLF